MKNHRRAIMIEERELRNAYLNGCRILQWIDERLPVDLASCAMRGMAEPSWYKARSLLIASQVMNAQLEVLVPLTSAHEMLQAYFKAAKARSQQYAAEIAPKDEHAFYGHPENSVMQTKYMQLY